MSATPSPTALRLDAARATLTITWSDGHSFTYALRYLRGWCPCASCQGHFNPNPSFIESGSAELTNVEPVGGYAVSPIWADGHQSGIYTYRYLLALELGPPGVGPSNDALLGAGDAQGG